MDRGAPPVNASQAIRNAIASGEIQKASALWSDYAAVLQQELRNGSFTARRLEEIRDLVEWSRVNVICARAHAQSGLNRMHAALQYCTTNYSGRTRIRVHF